MSHKKVVVIGAGLAGCEAAWQLARLGVQVELIEMKPEKYSPAHHIPTFAELVCSNSFRSNQLENGVGLLKEELRHLGSLLIEAADKTQVPAGGALAVDRGLFSDYVTQKIKEHPLIHISEREMAHIPEGEITIVATGPLTDGALFNEIGKITNLKRLHFFDAAAPIIAADSINREIVFSMSRYGKGGADYLNCPMNEDEYVCFYEALISAELADVENFDKEVVFEGCMPIETMAKRGRDAIRFGPMKPVGLIDPRTGKMPYACVQLRQDDKIASMYNIVGFQTRLRFPEQKRVFQLIPGLERVDFYRYGVMHRNTYLHSPGFLNADYSVKANEKLYFAGQMTGVEGYVESIGSGYIAGLSAGLQALGGKIDSFFSRKTMLGAMAAYISDETITRFQPMNANFGLVAPLGRKIKGKKERNLAYAQEAIDEVKLIKKLLNLFYS